MIQLVKMPTQRKPYLNNTIDFHSPLWGSHRFLSFFSAGVETTCLFIPSPLRGSVSTPSPVGAQDIQAGGEASWTDGLLDVQHCITPAEKRKTIPKKAPTGRQEKQIGRNIPNWINFARKIQQAKPSLLHILHKPDGIAFCTTLAR